MVPTELLWLPMWAGDCRVPDCLEDCRACNMDFNSATSLQRCSSSEVVLTVAIAGDGVATFMILSASWANLLRLPVSGVEVAINVAEKVHIGKRCLYPGLCLPIASAFFSKTVMVSYPQLIGMKQL